MRRAPRTTKTSLALRVLMIASEAHPFSKTGGLADVASSLPKALGRLGHDVTLVTPRYRGVDAGPAQAVVRIELAGHPFVAGLVEVPLGPGARALLVDCPPLYERSGIYNEAGTDYADNPVRYAFLAAAAIEWAAMQPEPFDIVHGHDWQAGLAGPYLRRLNQRAPHPGSLEPGHRRTVAPSHPRTVAPSPPRLFDPGLVFTVHNLAYQGVFDKSWVPRLGLDWGGFTMAGFEFWDQLSFLKSGVTFADAVTTVSPTYAAEIQRPEYGHQLDSVMRARSDVLVGILNGIDTDEWNPAADPFLPAPFDATDLTGKAAAKRALLEMFRLPTDAAALARPVVGMVSRMVDQKGLDLIAAVASDLPGLPATFVVVGSGEPRYQHLWTDLARWRPDRFGVFVGFDERRAHLVEAGADLFLMPSRFEPCGLNQMYSMRYGTVPVVRAVGGLVDTVRPYNPRNGQGTGFLFSEYQPGAMMGALAAALQAFGNRKVWTQLQKNGMRVDFSWDHSAAEYVKVYRHVIAARERNRVAFP